tara:strand:- start:303 stop:1262 length:960 start_codon:yes stop_codon:yes gene_type:complete
MSHKKDMKLVTKSDSGNKYKQPVNIDTPGYVDFKGIRMEDHCEVYKNANSCFISVSDGHGSVAHNPTSYLGGKESSMNACTFAVRYRNMNPFRLFERIQRELYTVSEYLSSNNSNTEVKDGYFVVNKTSPRPHSVYSMHGCTLSCLSIRNGKLTCSWVGDSSIMRYNKHMDEASFLTTSNHDIHDENDLKRVIENGGRRYGKSYVKYRLPDGEDYMFQLTRSLGHFGNKAISHIPEVIKSKVQLGDIFVVATDGLWKYVNISEVQQILRISESLENACDKMIEKAIKKHPNNRDNVCIVIVEISSKKMNMMDYIKNIFN